MFPATLEEAEQKYRELRQEYLAFRNAKFVEIEILHERLGSSGSPSHAALEKYRAENAHLKADLTEAKMQIEYFTMYATV